MAEYDLSVRQPLGAGKADIFRAHRLDHTRTGQPDQQTHLEQRQVDGRHDHMAPAVGCGQRCLEPQEFRHLAAPARRQPPQFNGKGHDQQHPDPESRHRKAQDRQRHDQLCADAVRAVSGI